MNRFEPPVRVGGRHPGRAGLYLLRIIVKRFRRGLVFKAHRPLHHSNVGSTVIKQLVGGTRGGQGRVCVEEDEEEGGCHPFHAAQRCSLSKKERIFIELMP